MENIDLRAVDAGWLFPFLAVCLSVSIHKIGLSKLII